MEYETRNKDNNNWFDDEPILYHRDADDMNQDIGKKQYNNRLAVKKPFFASLFNKPLIKRH